MKRIHYYIYAIGLAMAAVCAACSGSGDGVVEVPEVPMAKPTFDMPVIIYAQSDAPATRGLGDPGEYDHFPLPQHAYIYVATYSDADTQDASTFLGVTYMYEQLSTTKDPEEEAHRDSTKTASWTYEGQGVWRYTGNVQVPINVDTKAARAYVVLSRSEVDLSSTAPADEDAVKAVTFTLTGTDIGKKANQTLLKNLYSTPYNRTYTREELDRYDRLAPNDIYNLTDDEKTAMTGSTYYGTVIFKDEKNPRLYVTCYHVAAKMDLTWEVNETAQDEKELTALQVYNMRTDGCRLFDPAYTITGADWVGASVTEGGTYTYETTEGTKWYGRNTFYCIYQPTINLNYKLNSASEYTPYPQITVTDTYDTYVPWMRGYIKIGF